VGVLGLVGVIIAALATSGIGAAIAGGVKTALCTIASGGDCGERMPGEAEPSERRPDSLVFRDDGGTVGPSLGTGPYPIPGLPWDGSVSVGERSTDEPGLYLDASMQFDRSKCRLDNDGTPTVELGVTGTLRAGAMNEKENKGKTAGASADAYVGRDVSYRISTDPARAERISNRSEKPPTPVDPTSIPEGSSITLDESTFAGLDLGASYRGIQAALGYRRGQKVSAAVQRTDETHVQLTVGDADLVESSMSLALGTDAANVSVASDKALASGKTRQVDIDLATPAGQRVYQHFIKTGLLPERGAGVANPRSSRVIDYSASAQLGGKLAGLEGSLIVSDGNGQIVETTNPDGTTSVTQFAREDEVGITQQFTIGADGKPGPSSYSLRMQNVGGASAGQLAKQAGDDVGNPGAQDVTLNFDDDGLRLMRSAAVDQLQMHNPDLSRDEIKSILASGDQWRIDNSLRSPDPRVKFIAQTRDPFEIAKQIARMDGGDSAATAQWLADFGDRTTLARHGNGGNSGDHPEDAALAGPKLSEPGC